jgi:hypothetical protein
MFPWLDMFLPLPHLLQIFLVGIHWFLGPMRERIGSVYQISVLFHFWFLMIIEVFQTLPFTSSPEILKV